jgi:nitrate reductase gamma subunit
MLLGLVRHVVVSLIDVDRVVRRAGDRRMPYRRVAKVTMAWLFPVTQFRRRAFVGVTSFVFHVAIIVVPVLLAGHIALWRRNLGLYWPAIPNGVADVLTLVAILAALILVVQRALARGKRAMSRFQDYFLPLFIALPFVTGFLVMHPAWNPFSYQAVFLVHVMSANLLMVLVPTTKLSHAALMPEAHLITEAAWHWPSDAGRRVGMALGKEGEPI